MASGLPGVDGGGGGGGGKVDHLDGRLVQSADLWVTFFVDGSNFLAWAIGNCIGVGGEMSRG